MRSLLFLIGCLLLLSSATCKKTTANSGTTADSLQISRIGGFAGFSDHYMIYPNKVLKDTSSRDDIFSYPESSKVPAGNELLNSIPERMWQENNNEYGIIVADGIDYALTAYRKGKQYRWLIRHEPPAHVQPYTQKIYDFFAK